MRVIDLCLASCFPLFSAYSAVRPIGWALGLPLLLLTAHTLTAQVPLAWNPSPSATADGYRLYYGAQSRTYTAGLDVGPVTTYTVAGLTSGQIYYFVVTAYDSTDGSESAVSNEVSVTLLRSEELAPGGPMTLEAEAMALAGYLVESNADASGGALISRYSAAGVATAAFPGAAGTYDIIVAYFDEQDGQSTLAVTVNGEVVDTWLAGAGFPDSGPSAVTLTYRVVATGFPLAPRDVITLEGSEQGSEFVRVDKVDFVPVSSGEEVMGNKRWWRWRAARICWGRSSSTPGVRGR